MEVERADEEKLTYFGFTFAGIWGKGLFVDIEKVLAQINQNGNS